MKNYIIKNKSLRVITKMLLTCIILYTIIMASLYLYGSRTSISSNDELDYVLILGAKVQDDGPTKTLKLRLDRAVNFIKDNDIRIPIIVSGGKGLDEPFSEAQSMRDYLISMDIPSSQIILEDKATNTSENIIFSKKLMKNGYNVLLVTNDFHMARSTYLGSYHKLSISRLPASNTTSSWLKNLAREPLAFVKTLVFDR